MKHFGLVSRPPVGSDALAFFPDGDNADAVVVATGNQALRLTGLTEGDAALYESRGAHLCFEDGEPVLNGGRRGGLENVTSTTVNDAKAVTINGAETVEVTASVAIDFDTPVPTVTGGVVAADVG